MKYAIIAAGLGSRLQSEGVSLPKPLVKLNGESMIDRLIRIFVANHAESVSVIVNEEMKEVQEHLKSLSLPVPLHLVIKSTPSSMHSFFELSPSLEGGKFCLTTVDTIFKEDEFASYIKAFEQDDVHDGLMAVTDYIDDEKPLYVATDPSLSVTGFMDSAYPGARYISGGIYCLNQAGIHTLHGCMNDGVSRMRNYQRRLVEEGVQLKAYPFSKIIDVDHAEDIQKAENFIY